MASTPTLQVLLENPSTAGSANNYLVFGDATYGLFDTGEFAGPLGNQVNKITSVRRGSTKRGSSDQQDLLFHASTGTASVDFDNLARAFDPTSNSDIEPGRSFQVIATWAATDYTLFTGTVDDWTFTYPANARDAVATCTAVDGIAQIAAANVDEELPRQLTSERVRALLALAAWDPTAVALSTGLTEMPLAERRAVSAWSALTEAADSELGEFYVTGEGVATFRSRTDPVEETRSNTSQATFGPSNLKYHDVQISYGTERVRNDISVEWSDDADPKLQSDATSIRKHKRRSVSVRTSMVDGSVAQNLAQLFVDIYKDPTIRIDGIVIKPRRDPATLWPEVLGREIGDRITVTLNVPGGGTITRDAWVRGISHEFTADLDWTTKYVLQDLSNYRTYITFGTTQFDDDPHYFFF